MIVLYVAVAVLAAGVALYLAVKSREVRKFLSGAFFVSGGILLYLSWAKVSVPLLGTTFVQTPQISQLRGIAHLVLFAITFYFGFLSKPKPAWKNPQVHIGRRETGGPLSA